MKLAAVVILYNSKENIYRNLNSYSNYIEKLFAVDNSKTLSFNSNKIYSSNIEIIHDGFNLGIAKRLNDVIKKCKKKGFTHLLTMDQDSFFSENDFVKYIEIIKSLNTSKFGMIGLIHDAKFLSQENQANKLLITSGSIINIDIALNVGLFDENLFIDGVDTEFCLKLWKNGYQTILIKSIVLNHNLGVKINAMTFSLKKENRITHNKKRIYYIVRNHFYLRNKFNENKDQLPFKPIINEIKNAIFYGNEKAGSFIMALKGYFHFLIKKMGKQL